MATQADIGKWAFTHAATAIEEVLDVSGLGKSNNLVDVTNFDSDPGTMEYIAGLSDGTEFTVSCNYIDGATGQDALVADVDAGATAAFTLAYDSTTTRSFNGVCMGWEIAPSTSEQNQINFTIKVSGDITKTP